MGSITSLDGTFEKTLTSATDISGLPAIIQKYMAAGVSSNKLTFTKLFDENSIEKTGGLENVIAQPSVLDEKQQQAFINLSDFNGELKKTIQNLLLATKQGEKFNSKLFEQEASKDDKLSKGVLNEVMQTTGMKDADGNYLLTNTKDVCDLLEQYANDANNAQKAQELFNAGLLEQSDNGYKVSASLLKLIGAKKSDIVTTGIATAGQMAWNYAMQIGKQLLFSLGVAAVAFIATKLVDYIMNLKTHSEELVDAMNDSHDAAQQATKDVEEIQSKIDELNKSLKDAGVDKIEDIVDPAERERLQAVNDRLQAQLELKKQLEKDANDKANADTSAVVNDKTEDSIVKSRTVNVSYAEGGANAGTHQVAEKVSKTESLEEHAAALNDLIDKRRELATAGKKDTQEYKDNEAAITAETEKVEGLSSAVSKQMDSYETDADSFAKYKDEYVAGTNAMTAATKALANANDDVGVSTTNYDILLQKIRAAKNEIDNGTKDRKGYGYVRALDTLMSSGLETGDDIRELSIVPANQTKEQAAAIAVLQKAADDAHVTLDQFISALESVGLIAVRNVNNIKSLSDAMSTLDNMQSAYQSCAEAVKEYNKTGYVSMDTLQSLCQLEPQYLRMLELKNGKLKINTKTAQTLTQANLQLAKASLLADTLNNIKENNNLAKAKSILGDVTAVIKDADTALAAAAQKSQNEAKDSGGWEAYDYTSRANSVLIDNYHTLSGLIDTLGKQSPSKIWGKDDTSKATKDTKTAIDAWSTLTSAMKEYNEQGYITFQTLKSLTDLEDKYSSMLKKNNVTGQLEMRTDDFYKLMKAELKEAQIKGDGASEAQYNKILEWTNRNIKNQTMSYWDLVAAIEGYSAALSGAKEITDTFKDAWGNGKTVKEKQEKSRAGALDYEGTEAQSSALQDLMKYSEYDPELVGKAFNKETGKIDLSGDMLKTAVTESLKQQAAAARTEGGAAAEAIAASYEKSAENIENDVISVQDYFDGLGSTIEEVSSKIDEVQSAFTDLDDIKDEYDIYGGLSVDSLQKLLTMSPDYIACLEMEGDQLIFNRDKMVELLIAQLESKKEFLLSKEETKDQAEIIQKIIDALRKDSVNALAGMNYQAEKFKSALSDAKDVLSSLLSLLSSLNDKSNNDLKIWGDVMNKVIDKRIEALNKQKEALEENNEATERAIELSRAQDALARAEQQRTTRVYTENGYEWQANAEDVRTAREDLADKKREWNKKDAEKAIDDQIKKYNEFKDKLSEVMDDIGKSWKDYQKELEYTAQIQQMTITQMEGLLDGYHNKIIASLNTGSAITSIQNLITNLESLINTLVKVNNLYSKLKTGEYKDLGTKGLWNTIKGFFNKGGEEAAAESGKTVETFFEVLKNKVQTSGNGLIDKFKGIWKAIKAGAQNTFGSSGSGGGIVPTVIDGFKTIGGAVKNSKIGSAIVNGGGKILGGLGKVGGALLSGGGKLVAGAGKLITTAGSALAAAGPAAIPIAGAAALGIYGTAKNYKHQKEIWSNKEDGFGKKAIKSVATFIWDTSPIGAVVNLCKDIFGKSKETAENTKDTADSSSETAENTKKATGVTNLTINATQGTISEENKTEESAPEEKKQSAWDKFWGSKLWFWNWGKKASGDKKIKHSGTYNVDEAGPEMLVRQPASGRYTYLETGDGVVPADITSRLFEMGGNPDKWFSDQLAKNGSASMVQSRSSGGISLSIGDVNVNNPVGDSDALASELVNRLPNRIVQQLNKR